MQKFHEKGPNEGEGGSDESHGKEIMQRHLLN